MIEYLENNNFTEEQIVKLQNSFKNVKGSVEQTIERFEFIYKVFSYTCANKNLINEIISDNPSLLTMSGNKLTTVAYVWNETGLLNDIEQTKKSLRVDNILKVYLRYAYLTSNIMQREHNVSYYGLTCSEDRFLDDFSPDYNKEKFSPTFNNLVSTYGKGNTLEEKRKFLEDYLLLKTKKWFMHNYAKEREKRKNATSRKPL